MTEQSLFATYAAIAAVISACVALASAIIGPLVSLKIAKNKLMLLYCLAIARNG